MVTKDKRFDDLARRTAITAMQPPPYQHSHRPQPQNGSHRKDRIENGEIIRETDFRDAHGHARFPVTTGQHPLPHHSGPLVEKDEFNKIIPESKKAPQVGKDPVLIR